MKINDFTDAGKTKPKQTQPVVSLPAVSKVEPISEKLKMKLNFYSTKDYENQGRLRTPSAFGGLRSG